MVGGEKERPPPGRAFQAGRPRVASDGPIHPLNPDNPAQTTIHNHFQITLLAPDQPGFSLVEPMTRSHSGLCVGYNMLQNRADSRVPLGSGQAEQIRRSGWVGPPPHPARAQPGRGRPASRAEPRAFTIASPSAHNPSPPLATPDRRSQPTGSSVSYTPIRQVSSRMNGVRRDRVY